MAPNPNQPRAYDVVLGVQTQAPVDGAVLGGLPGVERRLASPVVTQRVAALKEILKYGQILASGSQDRTIKLWHLHTGELLRTLTGHWGEVNSVVISSDGHTLVTCSWDETIRLWHLGTGAQLHSLEGHQGAVACVAISPDGQKIVSGSWDQTIRVWGVQ